MTQVFEQERELHRAVALEVESALPEVEVLAVELAGRERMCVYLDHPDGVDHSLCARVTGVLAAICRTTRSRSPRRGSPGRCARVRTLQALSAAGCR